MIRRLNEWSCYVMADGATHYLQGGVYRHIDALFPCPMKGLARERWGNGARELVVTYPEGEVSISEQWPTEVTR